MLSSLRPLAVIIFAVVIALDGLPANAVLPSSHYRPDAGLNIIETQVEVQGKVFDVEIAHSGDLVVLKWSHPHEQIIKTTKITVADLYRSKIKFQSNALTISDVFIMQNQLFLIVEDSGTSTFPYRTIFDVSFEYSPSVNTSFKPLSTVLASAGILLFSSSFLFTLNDHPDAPLNVTFPATVGLAAGFSAALVYSYASVVDYIKYRQANSNWITPREFGVYQQSNTAVPTIELLHDSSGALEDVQLTVRDEKRRLSEILLTGDCRQALKPRARRSARFLP